MIDQCDQSEVITARHDITPFVVIPGIDDFYLEQLIHQSKTDEEIAIWTPGDSKRFASKESYLEWLNKGRYLYHLVDPMSKHLCGIVWFGLLEMPRDRTILLNTPWDYGTTFAIRIYKSARGKGLGLPFMKKAVTMFKKSAAFEKIPRDRNQLWLETSWKNTAAVSLYLRFGLQWISIPDDQGRILMTFPDS